MSAIETDNIDINYPVPGQDNDSQGFRDNFFNIREALNTAKSELEEFGGIGFVISENDTVPAGWTSTGHFIRVEEADGTPLGTRYRVIIKDA